MPQLYRTHSKEETQVLGRELAGQIQPGTLVTFEGELGAGKTTLIQGFLEGFGAQKPYVSPTFVLMKQYELPEGTQSGIRRVYHADAYRVGEKDFRELGFAEWLADPEGIVLLEWPERLPGLLPENHLAMKLTSKNESEREISVS